MFSINLAPFCSSLVDTKAKLFLPWPLTLYMAVSSLPRHLHLRVYLRLLGRQEIHHHQYAQR
ncbi:MAG: hypothetical protein ACKVIF_14890, partial [Rhodospirillales bacterium]